MTRGLLLPGDNTHFVKSGPLPSLARVRLEMKISNLTAPAGGGNGQLIRFEGGGFGINIAGNLQNFLFNSLKSGDGGAAGFMPTNDGAGGPRHLAYLLRFQFDPDFPRFSLELWATDGTDRLEATIGAAQGVTNSPVVADAFVSIGNAYAGAPNPIGAARIDWCRVYNTNLPLASAAPAYAAPAPGATLVAAWEFEDSLADASGNGHPMVWQGSGAPAYEDTPGEVGGGGPVATQLVVTTQPGNAASGVAQVPQPVAEFRDASNAVVVAETSLVTATLIVTAGAAVPIGANTKAAVAGVANFAGNGMGATSAGGATAKWRLTSGTLSVDTAPFTIAAGGGGPSDVAALATALGDPGDGSVLPVLWSRRYGKTNNGAGRATSVADARGAGFGTPLVGTGTLPVINPDGSISTDGATNGLMSADLAALGIDSACTFFYIGTGPPVGGLWPARLSSLDDSRAFSIRDVFDGHYAADMGPVGDIPYHGIGMPAIDAGVHMHLMSVSDFPAGLFSVNNPNHSYELAGRLKRINFYSGYQAAGANRVMIGQSASGTYHTPATFYAAGFIRGAITRAQINALRVWAQTYEGAVYFAEKNGLIMYGDSLTFGLFSSPDPTSTAPLAYVMQQSAPYDMAANYDSLNLGFSSRQAFNAIILAPTFLHSQIGTFRARDVVILWLGTNDIAVHNRTAAQVAADLQTLITGIKAQGGKVAVCTLIPRGSADMDATKVGYFTTLNANIRANAVSVWGADLVIDLASIPEFSNFSLSGGGSFNDATYYSDAPGGVHMTALGDQVLATSYPNGIYPRLVASGVLVQSAPATHLAMQTQPSSPIATGSVHAVQPQVALKDATNATAIGDSSVVTATLVVETGAATPLGTLNRAAFGGVASFTDLGATSPGGATAHWHFTDGSLVAVDSATFVISPTPADPATHLVMQTQPSSPIPSGASHTIAPVVALKTAANATAVGDNSIVTAALVVETGAAVMIGSPNRAAIAGIADFAGNGLGAVSADGATAHWHFTDGALLAVDSATFVINAAAVPVLTDFLIIGPHAYEVVQETADWEYEYVGTPRRRTHSARIRSTERARFIHAKCTIGPLTTGQLGQLLADCAPSIVDINGAWLGVMRANVQLGRVVPHEDAAGTPPGSSPGVGYTVEVDIMQAAPGQ